MPKSTRENGWCTFRFHEMATMVNDRVDDPSAANVDRYVGLEHLDSDSLKIRRWGSPTDVKATKLRFHVGDIIFGRRRVYQRKLAVADFNGICSAHAMVLRANPKVVLPEFLPFFMQSDLFMERALAISVGSLSPTINWKTLADEQFIFPCLDVQRSLGLVLQSTSDLVASLYTLFEESKNVYRSCREHLFSSNDFRKVLLGSLIDSITAGSSLPGANTPPREREFGVLKVSSVDPNEFDPEESKRLLDQNAFRPELAVSRGNLLMTRANTSELVGEVCLTDRDYPNLMLSDKTLRIEVLPHVDKELLWESLQTESVRRQIKSLATGTGGAMKNISQPKIRNLIVASPRNLSSGREALAELLRYKTTSLAIRQRLLAAKTLATSVKNSLITRMTT